MEVCLEGCYDGGVLEGLECFRSNEFSVLF